jgi:hypothetical protein
MFPVAGDKGKKAGSPGDLDDLSIDWTLFYSAGRKIGLAPSEFWNMTLPELFQEIELAKQAGRANAPTLTDEDRARYTDWLNGGDG